MLGTELKMKIYEKFIQFSMKIRAGGKMKNCLKVNWVKSLEIIIVFEKGKVRRAHIIPFEIIKSSIRIAFTPNVRVKSCRTSSRLTSAKHFLQTRLIV